MAFGQLIPTYNPTPPPLTPEEEEALAAEQAQVIDTFGAPSPVVDPAAAAPVGEVQTIAPDQSYQAAPPPEQVAAPPPVDESYQGMGYEPTDPGMGYEGDPATVAAQAPAPEANYVPAPIGAVQTLQPDQYVAPPPTEPQGGMLVGADAVAPPPLVGSDAVAPTMGASAYYGGTGGGIDPGRAGPGGYRQTTIYPRAGGSALQPIPPGGAPPGALVGTSQGTRISHATPNTGNASGPGNFVRPTDADRRAIADRRAAGITEAGIPTTPADVVGRLNEDYGRFLEGNPEVENFILNLAGPGPVGMVRPSVVGGFGKGAALNAMDNVQGMLRAADDAIAMRAAKPTTAKGQIMEEALDVASDTNVGLVDAQGNPLPRIAGPETFIPEPPPEPMPLPPQTMTGNRVMPNRVTYPNPRTVTGDAVVPSTKRVAGETFVEPPVVEAPIRQPTTTVSGRPSLGQANADVVTEIPQTGWRVGRAEKNRPVPPTRANPEPPAVGGEVFRPVPPPEPMPRPVEVGVVVARDLPPINKNMPAAPKKGGVYEAPPPRDMPETPGGRGVVVEPVPAVEQPVNLVEAPIADAPVTPPPAKTTSRGGKLVRLAKGAAKLGAAGAAAAVAANKLIYPDGIPVNETGADHVVNPSGDGTYNPRDPNEQAPDELWATQDRIDRGEVTPIGNLQSTDVERKIATVIKATGKPPATVTVEPRVDGISVWRDTETDLPIGYDDGTDFTGVGKEYSEDDFDLVVAKERSRVSGAVETSPDNALVNPDVNSASDEEVAPSAPKAEGATPIYESSSPANDGGGSSGNSPVYSGNSYDNNNYGYEPSPGGSTTRRGASRTDASADVSSLFGDLADSGDMVLEDFYKDYDGDGVISAKDRRKGKLAFAAAKKKRRGMRRSGRTGTSTMPVRTDSALRSQILAALDASMAS